MDDQYEFHHPSDDVIFSQTVLEGLTKAINGALASRAVLEYRLHTDRGRVYIKTPCLRVEGDAIHADVPLLGDVTLLDICLRQLLREEALVDWALERNEAESKTETINEFTVGRPHGASFHAWRGRR